MTACLSAAQQPAARRIGLLLALVMRVALLLSITGIIGLTAPAFSLLGHTVSWRDLVLGGGGLFLLAKGTMEIHHTLEGQEAAGAGRTSGAAQPAGEPRRLRRQIAAFSTVAKPTQAR